MKYFISMLIGCIIGGLVNNSDTALKLSNVMNASMLDCVTDKVITKEQVHDIETIFRRHIEANFKYIKAGQSDNCKKDKE